MIANHSKRGFVLVVSVMLLLSISVITAAFISMVTVRTRAAASGLESAKAFWLAEAGIQQVIYRVNTDANYRNAPTNITGSLNDGTYTVSVTKQAGQEVYVMVSTGTVGAISRNITQTATIATGWPKSFNDYGAFIGSGNISMKYTSKIVGDDYASGSVSTVNTSTVTGTVYSGYGSGNYTRLPLPSPLVPSPTLNTTYYVAQINIAKTYSSGNKTYNTLNLAGKMVYVNGTVTATNISGPGTITANGSISVNGGTVGQGVTIISNGTLSFAGKSRVQSGAVLYAKNSVSSTASDVIMTGVAILTPGVITLSNTLTISGAIFSNGSLTIGSTVVVNGAVASGSAITFTGSGQVVHSKSQLPAQTPNGIESAANVVLSDWQSL